MIADGFAQTASRFVWRRMYARPQQSLLPVTQSETFRSGRIDRYRLDEPSYSRETQQSIDADAEKNKKQLAAEERHRNTNARMIQKHPKQGNSAPVKDEYTYQ